MIQQLLRECLLCTESKQVLRDIHMGKSPTYRDLKISREKPSVNKYLIYDWMPAVIEIIIRGPGNGTKK